MHPLMSFLCTPIPPHYCAFSINLFIFNWRTVALQYCVRFCHTSTWISHQYTYVPSLLKLASTSHSLSPSRLSQSTGFEVLASYSKFQLSNLHTVMYMFQYYSLNLSQPLFSPTCPQICSLHLPLHCCPANRFISCVLILKVHLCVCIPMDS